MIQKNLADSLYKATRKLVPKSDLDSLNDYLALPEEIKIIAQNYWQHIAEGINFRVLYQEAYREGYEDCELKWREINVSDGRAD